MTGNKELFCLVQVLLRLQLCLEFHKILSVNLSCFSCMSKPLLKTLTPIILFADYTSLYIIVDDLIQAADQLNSDLVKIHRWVTNG